MNDKKPLGYYKKKSDRIVCIHDESTAAVITHWDFFHVNRETGHLMNNACRVEVTSGDEKGKVFVAHCNWIGDHSTHNDWHWA